jgi:hypothetical protein
VMMISLLSLDSLYIQKIDSPNFVYVIIVD